MTEQKLTPREKRALKRKAAIERGQELSGTFKGALEPIVTESNYTVDLIRALNYYSTAYDTKDKRKWVLSYVGKAKAKLLESIEDSHFIQLGAVIRLKQRDQHLQEHELHFIDSKLEALYKIANQQKKVVVVKEEKPSKPVLSVQERIAQAAIDHAGEFEGMIDDYVKTGVEPDFASYLKANNVSPQVSKLIAPRFEKALAELKEAFLGKDAQLVEGYSNFSKVKLRRLIKVYETIAGACDQRVVSAKAERKPRARKEKPAAVLAAKVKYKLEDTELGVKSEHPSKIVGASEVWVFNTKYKKLQVYRAADDGKLSVKGTTIINYEVAGSGAKTIRKPETVKDFVGMTKKTFATAYKALKTKEAAVNGRLNEDCLIIKIV